MSTYKKISNIKRLRQIVNSFVRHGLGHLVKLSGLDTYISLGKRLMLRKDADSEKEKYTNPQRMAMVFEELGPTFIKLGQILSTRKDQIPKEYIAEFEKLQDSAAPLDFEKMDMVFETEFGKNMDEVFEYIDKTPIASASIGQVHAARLKSGEKVVVKVRKPGIEHIINADIKILYFLANQIQKMIQKDNPLLCPADIVKEFETVIKNELDFVMEGRNIERFQNNFKDKKEVHFPLVHWEYTSPRILVMEMLEGISVGNLKALRDAGYDLRKIAYNLFQLTLKQMLIDGFFHADPHPGNFIIMENEVIGVIDCGMVGILEKYFMDAFIECFAGIFLKDYDLVVKGYMAVGSITEDVNKEAFKEDIRKFSEHYMNISLNTVSIGTLLEDAINVGVRNKMKIPSTMLFTSRALITIEGAIKKIDPGFDFLKHSATFAKNLIMEQKFDPKKYAADFIHFVSGIKDLLRCFPRQSANILTMLEQQKLVVNINIVGTENFIKKISNLVTAIALSVIAAGLGIASSLVIQAKIRPLIYEVSALGIFGYIMAVVLGIWVVFIVARRNR